MSEDQQILFNIIPFEQIAKFKKTKHSNTFYCYH